MESMKDFKKRIKANHKFVSFMMKLYHMRPNQVYRYIWTDEEK